MIEVKIKSEEKSYPIIIENEAISDLREKIFANLENYLVVISAKVEKLYGKQLNIPKERKFVLKDGEKEKNFKNFKNFYKLVNASMERASIGSWDYDINFFNKISNRIFILKMEISIFPNRFFVFKLEIFYFKNRIFKFKMEISSSQI